MSSDSLFQEVKVVAYSGYRANERPLYFILDQRRLGVEKTVDRWYETDHDYFKVRADDGRLYVLRWHRSLDRWFIEKIMEE